MKDIFADLPNSKNTQRTARIQSGGFTLVEVLMCIAILSIIFGTVFNTFDTFIGSFTQENVRAGVQQKARLAVDLMAQDIRLAGLNPKEAPGGGIIVAQPTTIQIRADLDYDGDFGDPYEDITYALNGDRLEQTNHLGTETLIDNVAGLTFTYISASTVGISLTVQESAGLEGSVSRTYTTRVRCRNL